MATMRRPAPRAKAAAALPLDVRLMNGVALLIFVGVLAALLWQTVKWATRSPLFTVRAIVLETVEPTPGRFSPVGALLSGDGGGTAPPRGTLKRSSVASVRTNALPHLDGNFFSIDLDAARAAFESVPWVRRAAVRRIWPDRLAVTLEEHQAAALWHGDGRRNERLVNTYGEVFEANSGDVDDEALPTLAGADAASAQMLALLQRLGTALAPIDQKVHALRLSSRGSWRAELSGGAKVELGRGSDDELVARVDLLARTLPEVAARFGSAGGTPRALVAADLRHPDGYALRLAGITTAASTAVNKKP
jgi:cell division protein FtsQ